MHPYAILLLTPVIVLFGVVGIFIGRRLMKNEEWRATGIFIIALSIVGIVAICGALYSVRGYHF